MECWYCYWGWSKPVHDIYAKAIAAVNDALLNAANESNDWKQPSQPYDGKSALEFGPAHIVWSDENWDCAKLCLKECDKKQWRKWPTDVLEIVRQSLRDLIALPAEVREPCPSNYEGEHPQNYPPPPGVEMVKKHG